MYDNVLNVSIMQFHENLPKICQLNCPNWKKKSNLNGMHFKSIKSQFADCVRQNFCH